jgi:ribosome maturation factor RimP
MHLPAATLIPVQPFTSNFRLQSRPNSSLKVSKSMPEVPFDDVDDDFLLNGEDDDNDDEGMLLPDDMEAEINTAGLQWAEQALTVTQSTIQSLPDLELYSFQVIPNKQRVDIRLDKLTDQYGSPSLDEIEQFSVAFYTKLEEALGEDMAGSIEIEVSSPGAERRLRLPHELLRFSQLPMKVEYIDNDKDDTCSEGKVVTRVMDLVDVDVEVSRWRLADVKANSPGKGRSLNKKMREQVHEINIDKLKRVNLHIDI